MKTSINKPLSFQVATKTRLLAIEIITYLFVLLFIYTAASKIMTFESFINVLGHSPLIQGHNRLIAWAIVSVEIGISIMLIIPQSRKIGLYGSFSLMTLFTIYLIYMVTSGVQLPCYCGGVVSAMTWTQHVWFNIAITGLAWLGIKFLKYGP